MFDLKEFRNLALLDKVHKANSLLNVRDVKNRMPASFRLLTASSAKDAKELAQELFKKSLEKKQYADY